MTKDLRKYSITIDSNPEGINQYTGAGGEKHTGAAATKEGKAAGRLTRAVNSHPAENKLYHTQKEHDELRKMHEAAGKAQRAMVEQHKAAGNKGAAKRAEAQAKHHEGRVRYLDGPGRQDIRG